MGQLILKPNFNKLRNQLTIPHSSLNVFMREEVVDSFSFYQKQFGVYSFMKLNSLQEFVIHTIKGQPFMWQPHLNCSWDDTGSLRLGKKTIPSCKAKINESWCYDELFDSCFKHLLKWPGKGPLNLDPTAIAIFNEVIRTLTENAAIGALLTLTVGKLYDVNLVEFTQQTPGNIQQLFARTMNTCKGWIELVRETATMAGYEHLNMPALFDEADFVNSKWVGDPIALYDTIRGGAKADMQVLFDEGGIVDAVNGTGEIIMKVTAKIYARIAQVYREQCVSVTCINPRLTRKEMQTTLKGRPKTIYVFYIDETPVVPVTQTSYSDKYLTGSTQFAYLTVAGNIGLGHSFANVDGDDFLNGDVGIMIERETSVKDYGKYYFLSHALFNTAIANTDLMAGGQTYVVD
jgi:hypothetical protein